MPEAIQAVILADVAKPESATVDGITIKKRPLPDLIEADRYLAADAVGVNPQNCLVRVKLIHPGTIGETMTP